MHKRWVWTGIAVAALLTTFAVDLLVPLGVAQAILYVLVVLLAVPTGQRNTVIALALGGIVLGLLAFAIQYPPAPEIPVGYVIANRALSVLGIAVTAGLGIVLIEHWHRLSRVREKVDEQGRLLDMAGRLARFGAWSYDHDSRQIVWSDEIARIVEVEPGYAPTLDEGIELYAPEYRDEVRNALRRCVEQGTAWDEEWELHTTTGQRRWVRVIGEAVRDETGRLTGAQGAFQDIDARKRAEASAEQHRKRLRQLAESMPILVWTADGYGQIDFVNQRVLDYTGASKPDELFGEKWLSVLHPADRDRTVAVWTRSVETGAPYSIEFRIRSADGSYRWFQTSAMPMLDADDNVEHWFGACVDIHEQRELSTRLVQTLENMTEAFFACDRDWRFVYLNAAAERLIGQNREEVIGKELWEAFPDTRGTVFEHEFRKAMEAGEPARFTAPYDLLDTWVDVSAYADDDGLAIYARDITQQRKAEEQLRHAQRLESVGQLTGGIAHDFNNLLSVVIGNAELIQELSQDNPEIGELAEMIGSAAVRGSELTRRLLAFARKQALEPGVVDVNRLVADMDPLLRRTLGEHIEIELARGAGLWPAMIDPGQLEDTLLNLSLNARDAMPDGGKLTIETYNARIDEDYAVEIEELPHGQYVAIAVSDTGHGIEPEHLDRVFEPFFTTGKKERGTGLGLAMVYGFIKQSGGHVRIYSEPGQGTTVRLYLPRTHENPSDSRKEAPERLTGDETILLVEDDELLRQVAHSHLDRLGYTVLEAGNGPEALEWLNTNRPIDLLFTDVVMPGGMSGRQLAEQAEKIRPGLKVLYTFGYTENAIVHHGRLDPGVHLLSKPYRQTELSRSVRRALEE